MSYEKSCGGIIIRRGLGDTEYLVIYNQKPGTDGHWGFPKGHTEEGETELMTARREIFEETGLSPEYVPGFRIVSSYSPREGVDKDAVYFLFMDRGEDVTLQASEVSKYAWADLDAAKRLLTFDEGLLLAASKFINENELPL